MFTAVGSIGGNVVTDGLNAWFDFGDIACFNPTQGTGSISGGTTFNNLAPGQSAISGTIQGAVNFSEAFGGCMNLTNNSTSFLSYTAGLSASFTTQVIVTPGTDADPNLNFVSDGGGWPGFRPATNGFVNAQASFPNNNVVPIIFFGSSATTLTAIQQPTAGNQEYMRFPNLYTFSTSGTNLHKTYTNNVFIATDTSIRTRGDSALGVIYLNRDTAVGNRHGIGRIVAYLHYNRQLSDGEVYQNAQYYLNRLGTK